MGAALAHDAARLHVTGAARYVDDIPLPADALHLAFGLSDVARGRILTLDLDAVRASPGVVMVLCADDFAEMPDCSPSVHDEPLLALGEVHYAGQPVFLVVADTHLAARRAARLARLTVDASPPILTIDDALAAGSRFEDGPVVWSKGDAEAAIAAAPYRVEGTLEIGGQEHFYLEGQVAACLPQEGGDMVVHASTQHPTEVQHKVAHALHLPMSAVRVEVRRMGGAFGGKESQGNALAVACAVAAARTGRPCKMRYDRDDDMVITGKRHDLRLEYRAGFDGTGRIAGITFRHLFRCGWSRDLSTPVADRAMLHADNCYHLPAVRIESHRLRTNTQSATAYRGFGGPQGMIGIEAVMDHVARTSGHDPVAVRRANFYAPPPEPLGRMPSAPSAEDMSGRESGRTGGDDGRTSIAEGAATVRGSISSEGGVRVRVGAGAGGGGAGGGGAGGGLVDAEAGPGADEAGGNALVRAEAGAEAEARGGAPVRETAGSGADDAGAVDLASRGSGEAVDEDAVPEARPRGVETTPYHMPVEDFVAGEIVTVLERTADYRARRAEIDRWNATSGVLKRGIALSPVKFGISFTLTHLNQAGALVHVYQDGSVHLNHGGTEMGQGLFRKVAQVAAGVFGLPPDAVKITATDTAKVPNTSATAASSGSDLNGMAAQAAAETIRDRIAAFLAERSQTVPAAVTFAAGKVSVGAEEMAFADAAALAYAGRVSLSATGFYATPKITWDRARGRGRPFLYFAYGAAVTEVVIDTLTGENRILRADILHDAGRSLNPALDIGQIEGGYVQGAGWLTTEELVWDAAGRLATHAPSTYKIPACSDRPAVFNVALWDAPNRERTVGRSKAVGEPPFMLGISAWLALRDAVAACGDGTRPVGLDAPATAERVLAAVEDQREAAGLDAGTGGAPARRGAAARAGRDDRGAGVGDAGGPRALAPAMAEGRSDVRS